MTSPAQEDLLQLVLGDAVESGEGPPSGAIDVARLLTHLAHRGTEPLGDRGRETLEILCRKISVAKRVWRRYDQSWKRAPDAGALRAHDWSLLIAVLLIQARMDGAEEIDIALAVKYLNAALEALDLAAELDDEDPHLAGLRARAGEILESLNAPAEASEP